MKALVIDDTRTMRLILKNWLNSRAWDVLEADSGAAARAVAAANPLDLLIVDLHLPDEDGSDLTQAIRTIPGRENVPALFISTSLFEVECQAAVSFGPGAYLLKPLKEQEFLAVADRLVA